LKYDHEHGKYLLPLISQANTGINFVEFQHSGSRQRPRRGKRGSLFERATPKIKGRQTDVRVLFAREFFTRLLAVAKLLKGLVARDGIEPPTPAFSGPPTESPKWFEIN
jgi:hypothetical protein